MTGIGKAFDETLPALTVFDILNPSSLDKVYQQENVTLIL